MSIPFNTQHGLIIIQAAVDGLSGSAVLRLALDTGATRTVINVGMLVALGYDPALVPERIQVTTGSGVEFVPRIFVHKIVALGQERTSFPVLGHTLPPALALTGCWGWILCGDKR
jgi:predicted aspartyl protease